MAREKHLGKSFKKGEHLGDGLFVIRMPVGEWCTGYFVFRQDIVIMHMSVGGYKVSGFHHFTSYRVTETRKRTPTEMYNDETKQYEIVDDKDLVTVTYYYKDGSETEDE